VIGAIVPRRVPLSRRRGVSPRHCKGEGTCRRMQRDVLCLRLQLVAGAILPTRRSLAGRRNPRGSGALRIDRRGDRAWKMTRRDAASTKTDRAGASGLFARFPWRCVADQFSAREDFRCPPSLVQGRHIARRVACHVLPGRNGPEATGTRREGLLPAIKTYRSCIQASIGEAFRCPRGSPVYSPSA
jgi:hypothetical protein